MNDRDSSPAPQTLGALYSIVAPIDVLHEPPHEPQLRIHTLSPRQSFVELTRGTFNYRHASPARLERQFSTAAHLASLLPIKTLAYPRTLDRLRETVAMVIADLAGDGDHRLTRTVC
jgi:hypothetical protein